MAARSNQELTNQFNCALIRGRQGTGTKEGRVYVCTCENTENNSNPYNQSINNAYVWTYKLTLNRARLCRAPPYQSISGGCMYAGLMHSYKATFA